jgi:hypothetical protein
MACVWSRSGTEFTLKRAGQPWTVRVDDQLPGLRCSGVGPVLGLEGVAQVARWAPRALSGATLIEFGEHFDRVEATYAPAGWADLVVRAAWFPCGDNGVDLEVQLSARSVEELRAVEVKLISTFGDEPALGTNPAISSGWVEPRDNASAALTYDGREPDTSGLITLPPHGAEPRANPEVILFGSARHPSRGFGPLLALRDQHWAYAEMVHPEDASRRILLTGMGTAGAVRYGLFGYDLERGVVLRARLRSLWLPRVPNSEAVALKCYQIFLAEPLPLGT